ncbi:TPR-like protein [Sporormia fimetaria CBS 119925]|uniref:TPR-like protein n=1 Tax=Sporormia fimetaria CBS 119925 TaxID=1340428 RepID=A0A6A6VJ62_9PLEO|nr:TPR-like protein [Sporormia fimetaria CBS 119925]
MATHQQPSPTVGIPHPPPHAAALASHPANGHRLDAVPPNAPTTRLQVLTEEIWNRMGHLSEQMGDLDGAYQCYKHALELNPWSVAAMLGAGNALRDKTCWPQAMDYYKQLLKIDAAKGDVWASLGICHMMMDELPEAYQAYQTALYHLRDVKHPNLWYGIGILYERYGSTEHAEEALSQVIIMAPDYDKRSEVYFRLGILAKAKQAYEQSLDCFKFIVRNPPSPLTEEDIWFQIGHVYEVMKEYDQAAAAYNRVLQKDPKHAKVLQQLGYMYHTKSTDYHSQERAIEYLENSVHCGPPDSTDAFTWYLLGRCYMSQGKHPKAYEAYQQAVYRDGRNPTFWTSIGVLYYQINQYRDALDAYSRAIRLSPLISEVWFNLGSLYESCNNQIADALDAYQRAADIDTRNDFIKHRIELLQSGNPPGPPPAPQDIQLVGYQPALLAASQAPIWGAPQAHGPPQAPAPQPAANASGWDRAIPQVRDAPGHPPPQAQLHPYEQKEAPRPSQQAPALLNRPPSPRQEAMRAYQEPPRPPTNGPRAGPSQPPGAAPLRRPLSPSPKTHHVVPSPYRPGHVQPPSQPMPSQAPPQQPLPPTYQQQQPPPRISNPNYGPHSVNAPPPPPPPPAALNAPPAGPGPHPYGRMASPPPPEVRPIVENRPGSPRGGYQGPYQHHADPSSGGGIASGAPAPASALVAAEAAAREREERPPTAPAKRMREWEDKDPVSKPPANEEKRQKVEETHSRRPTPPAHRISSPQVARHSPQPDARRFNDGYHPSEAAHHPPSLPPMNASQPPLPRMTETPKQERPEHHEPAARHMDVDEDYDDETEDTKPPVAAKSERGSPRNAASNGISHPASAGEQQ